MSRIRAAVAALGAAMGISNRETQETLRTLGETQEAEKAKQRPAPRRRVTDRTTYRAVTRWHTFKPNGARECARRLRQGPSPWFVNKNGKLAKRRPKKAA